MPLLLQQRIVGNLAAHLFGPQAEQLDFATSNAKAFEKLPHLVRQWQAEPITALELAVKAEHHDLIAEHEAATVELIGTGVPEQHAHRAVDVDPAGGGMT